MIPSVNWKSLKKKIKVGKKILKENFVEENKELGKYIAIDCEMVGVGEDGTNSTLARVSLVNYHGAVLLDRYCKPREFVTDFRTHVSGIKPKHVIGGDRFQDIQKEVAEIIKGRILIGHAISNDLTALLLDHPRRDIRDTSRYSPFRASYGKGRTPALKKLAKEILNVEIQRKEHSSVEDAKTTMLLYKTVKNEWEGKLKGREIKRRMKVTTGTGGKSV